jgi:hypothetical protein
MDGVLVLAGIFLLSALAEGLVEYLVAPWIKPEGQTFEPAVERRRTMGLRYSAAAVGVVLSLAYQADLLGLVELESEWPAISQVLTGLLIGRGSNYLHDFVGQWVRPSLEH